MRRTTACFLGLCLLFVANPSWAQTITLTFNSLPTAQGWTYQGQVLEANAFSVDGTNLTLNTIGLQANATAVYFRTNVIDPDLPFTISFRARVLQADVNGGLFLSTFSGTEFVSVIVRSGLVRVQGQNFTLDTTAFHDFRLEAVPGVGSSFFVDDAFLSGFPTVTATIANQVLFGDGSGGPAANASAQIQQFTFSQTPALSLQALIGRIEDLGSPGGPIPQDDATGLIAKLTNSLDLLNGGRLRPACNLLRAFINDVNSQVVQGTMPVGLGNALVSSILATREDLSC
jgi:hypothetical protein